MLAPLIAAGALLAAQTSAPPPPAPHPPITVTGNPQPAQKKVCQWSGTGTAFPKRICMTPEEWSRAEDDAAQALQKMREIQHGARCADFRC